MGMTSCAYATGWSEVSCRYLHAVLILAWGGFDTLHILAGVPSTTTLLQVAGVELVEDPEDKSTRPRLVPRKTGEVGSDTPTAGEFLPTKEGLDAVAAEARACGEINYVGTVLALAAFVSSLHELPLMTASYTCLVVKVTCTAPPVLCVGGYPRPLSLPLLCDQGCGLHGCRVGSCRV